MHTPQLSSSPQPYLQLGPSAGTNRNFRNQEQSPTRVKSLATILYKVRYVPGTSLRRRQLLPLSIQWWNEPIARYQQK